MKLESYLSLSGYEVGNGARFLAYVNNIGGPQWQVSGCSTGTITIPDSPGGYTDTYADIYGSDSPGGGGGSGTSLSCCTCSAINRFTASGTYVSPSVDNAPWYDSNVPASAEFLGFYPDITLGNVLGRDINPRSGGGGVLSSPTLRPRTISVSGTMAATTSRGMQFGERWMTEVLRGNGGSCGECDCGGGDLVLLPTCPDDGDTNDTFMRLVDVGLIDFVPPTNIGALPDHFIQQVSFQLASEQPYLYGAGQMCMDAVTVPDSSGSVYCLASTNTWPGDGATFRITIEASTQGAPASFIEITARPTFDGTCPPSNAGMSCLHYRIPMMDQDSVLTIDGRSRKVTYIDPTTKAPSNGLMLFDPYVSDRINGDLFTWPDMAPCTDLCWNVTNLGPAAVVITIEKFDKEL